MLNNSLLSLELPYTLREINKGLYIYASELGKEKYEYAEPPKNAKMLSNQYL